MYLEAKTVKNGASCPLCGLDCYQTGSPRVFDSLYICRTCGKFILDSMSELYLSGLVREGATGRYKISFAMRAISERALGKRDNSLFPSYSQPALYALLDQPEPPVQAKLDLLLSYLGRITKHPGQVNEFDIDHDYSIVCGQNSDEASFYFDCLVEQALLRQERSFTGSKIPRFRISAAGWQELNRITNSGAESSSAFIAMSFHPDRDPYEKAISATVRRAGYLPVRVDQLEHVNRIDDEIIARIRASKFLVADFTGQRNGVYFEAGFMLGLGRTVIWLCERVDLKNVHFDTRQYNTIDYFDEADLAGRLQLRIEAILGKGPYNAS